MSETQEHDPKVSPHSDGDNDTGKDNIDIIVNSKPEPLQDEVDAEREEIIHSDAQEGVQYMEAMASVWTKTSLFVAYTLMWIIFFVIYIEQTAVGTLTPFVVSKFGQL